MDWRVWLARSLWLIGFIVLTVGLLTTEPAEATQEMFTQDVSFSLSKLFHVLAYMVLTVLLALSRWPRAVAWGGVMLLVAHAAGTEYLQQFIPLRSGTLRDVGFDCLGILLGLLVTYRVWLRRPAAVLPAGRQSGSAA